MPYVRMKDIAQRAGVSINTVSHALKDMPDISKETKERIRALADELGYIPHASASNLRSKSTNTIGVVVTHVDNSFFSRILQGINDAISSWGFTIMTLSSNEDLLREEKIIRTLAANRVAGIILVPSRDLESGLDYDSIKVPHITIVRKGSKNTQNYFITDSHRSGLLAAERFIQSGRKEPGYLGFNLPVSCNESRFKGYLEYLLSKGVSIKEENILTSASAPQDAYKAVFELYKTGKGPDFLFVYNDQMTFGAIRALYDRGLSVPEDVMVLGHDDIPEARHFIPSLSTLRVPKYKLGYESATFLMELIMEETTPSRYVVYNPELIIRES